MSDFLSIVEAAEEVGWTPERLIALAMRLPNQLRIFVRPDQGGWDVWGERRRAGEGWADVGCPYALAEPIAVAPDVLRDQWCIDGVLRRVTDDGESLSICEEAWRLSPPRQVPAAALLVRKDEWAAVEAEYAVPSTGARSARDAKVARVEAAIGRGKMVWSPREAAERLGLSDRRLRALLAKQAARPTAPEVFAVGGGDKRRRYLLLNDARALEDWLDLVRASPPRTLRRESEVKAELEPEPKPTRRRPVVAARGSLRSRKVKGRNSK